MSALTRALEGLAPADVLSHLAAYLGQRAPHFQGSRHEGQVCDFRPGCEEENPSLSYGSGQAGPVFKRFGADGFEGGAVAFLQSAGLAKPDAVRLLIEWAGLTDEAPTKTGEGKTRGTPWQPTKRPQPLVGAKAQAAGVEKMREKLGKLAPLDGEAKARALRGFVQVGAGEDTPEAQALAARGLLPAVAAGALIAYRWTGQEGPEGGPYKTFRLPGQFRPGVVVFESTGPDGQAWGLRGRNAGTKDELHATKTARYATFKGMHAAPWVGRLPRDTPDGVRFLIVEGELNAAACWTMLHAAGQGAGHILPDPRAAGWEVQGVPSVTALPHVAHLPAGAQVYVYADPDEDGERARDKWAGLLAAQGVQVFQLGGEAAGVFPFAVDLEAWPPQGDACEALGTVGDMLAPDLHAAHLGVKLLGYLDAAKPWQPPAKEDRDGPPADGQGEDGDVWESKRRGYGIRGGKLCALTVKSEDGEDRESVEVLADFAAFITAEVIEEDGSGEARRVFQIEGTRPDGAPLFPPVVTVTTAEFSGMAWPVAKWGGEARLPAGNGKKDKARDAVQVLSNARGYPRRVVYQHTGWIQHPDHGPVYLTGGAVIGAAGAVDGVAVELGGRLAAYALPDPAKAEAVAVRDAVRASLALLDLAPDAVAVALLGAAYRAPLGASDFVLWTVGETGRHKTAFMGLVMAHYGAGWGRKFLPDGWNSSANALEANAFRVKDALFVIDDFKPSGGLGDRAKLDGAASRIIQGAADGAGRGTLTADRRTRAALYPRGLIATSAEDLPRGHSNRARLVMVEVLRRLIDSPAKSKAYFEAEEKAGAGVYALALAAFVQAVAGAYEGARVAGAAHLARVRQLAPHFQGAHGRTGDAAAELAYGWEVFLSFAVDVGAVEEAEALALWDRVTAALSDTAQGQGAHLADADPVARALAVLSGLLAQGRVFLEDRATGGTPAPDVAALCGWARREGRGEEEDSYYTRPGAVMVGYHGTEGGQDWAYFLPDGVQEALQRAVMGQGGAALPDAAKLYGNMRDRLAPAGLMKCEAEAGGRVRYTAKRKEPDGQRRHFVTLRLPLDAPYESLGTLGTLGTHGEESTSDTALGCVPNLSYFSGRLGTLGTLREESTSFSSPVPPSPAPGAGRVLALEDVDMVGEGEDLPGVVSL